MKKTIYIAAIGFTLAFQSNVSAGFELRLNDDTRMNMGFKIQSWMQFAEDAAPNGRDYSTDFSVRTARLYLNGQTTSLVKFGANLDWTRGIFDGAAAASNVAVVRDASITLDYLPGFKVMSGLYRTPFSRTALQDSFAYILPHSPDVASAVYIGDTADYRNIGVTAWGDVADNKIKYAAGIFDGDLNPQGATSDSDNPIYSARVTANLFEAEKGYTNQATYFGDKEMVTVGIGYIASKYNIGASNPAYSAMTLDLFSELPLGQDGVFTWESALFVYDRDIDDGKTRSFYVTLGVLCKKYSIQPAVRYENSDREGTVIGGEDFNRLSIGGAWYLKGNDAKLQVEYASKDFENEDAAPRVNKNFSDVTLVLQIQF